MRQVSIATTPEDLAICLKIREEVFIVEQNVPVTRERDEHDATALHFLVRENGAAIATARIVLMDAGKTAKIGRVAVIAAKRGGGIGQFLMQEIEKSDRLRDVEFFKLEAQTHALSFYQRLGYSAYGEEFMDAGIPHRSMKKANILVSSS